MPRFRIALDFDTDDAADAEKVKNWLETATIKIEGRAVTGPHPSKDNPTMIYTDGGCNNKTGIGAWAIVIEDVAADGSPVVLEYTGSAKDTTNNKMEMQAVIEALSRITHEQAAVIVCDSKYVIQGCTEWLKKWKKNGWKTFNGGPVKNRDEWEMLDSMLAARTKVMFQHAHGHSGIAGNERCDVLCTQTMQELESLVT